MIWTIIRKELLENLLSLRFSVAVLLCAILIPLSLYVNKKDYDLAHSGYVDSVRSYKESLKANSKSWKLLDFDPKGFRDPSPLRVFSKGLEENMPKVLIVSRDSELEFEKGKGDRTSTFDLFGEIDLTYVIQNILSLIAIVFTYNALSGERERGTLKLMMANPVPRDSVILAKYLGSLISLIIPLLCSFLIGFVVLYLSGFPLLFGEHLPRVLLILLASLLFVSAFLNLGLMVSAATERSASSLIVLLFLWAVSVLVIPKLSPLIAEQIYPAEPYETFLAKKAKIRRNIRQERDRLLIKATRGNSKEDYDLLRRPIVENLKERRKEELQRAEEAYSNKRKRQEMIARSISRISPASSFAYIVTELSNTGAGEAENFLSQAKGFRNVVESGFFSKGYKDVVATPDGGMWMRASSGGLTVEDVPIFQYRRESLSDSLRHIWIHVFMLFGFNAAFFACAFVLFLRRDLA